VGKASHRDAAADGDSKAVQGQADSDQEN